LYGRNAMLFLDGGLVGMTNLWGRRTARPLDELKCVELGHADRSLGNGQAVSVPTIRFLAIGGGKMFELRGKEFSLADLQRLSDAAQVPIVGSW
jgi:hypothetical protein